MSKKTKKPSTHRKDGLLERKISTPQGRKSVYGKNEKELDKKEKELLKTIKEQGCIPLSMRFSVYMERWLEEVKKVSVRKKTFDRYESTFRVHIRDSIVGRCQIGNISSLDIQTLINEKAKEYGISSIKKIHILLGECLRYAENEGHIGKNPINSVILPHEENVAVKKKEMIVFDEKDVEKFYATALQIDEKTNRLRYKYGPALILLLNTGMRAGELMALRKDCINLEEGYLKVEKTAGYVKNDDETSDKKTVRVENAPKTKNGLREIPLNEVAADMVREILYWDNTDKVNCPYLVHTSNNVPITHSNLQRALDVILKNAKMEHAACHSLRHSFSTLLISDDSFEDMKVDIKAVSEILGHANVGITLRIYYHPAYKKKEEAVKRLDFLKPKTVVNLSYKQVV